MTGIPYIEDNFIQKNTNFSQLIQAISNAFSNNTIEVAKLELKPLADKFTEVQNMLDFIEQSERGILR